MYRGVGAVGKEHIYQYIHVSPVNALPTFVTATIDSETVSQLVDKGELPHRS
jgi:hypothetical protein